MRIVSSAMLILAFASTAALSAENTLAKAPIRPHIIGGTDARIEDYPYQVQLAYISSDHRQASTCGGSVISASWILTAAHCIRMSGSSPDPNEFTVFTGASIMPDNGTPNSVAKVVIHPKYSGSATLHNDIALVKLAEPLQPFSAVQLAPLGLEVSGNVTVTGLERRATQAPTIISSSKRRRSQSSRTMFAASCLAMAAECCRR
ncbi:MAG: trypsin-like serine protease [Methylobacteriaceae bacterium]|nr:trypsin-like serine protease [Methylobacteriaceae bacterium]